MSEFRCNLPWPPTVNNYYTIWKGRKILSKRAKKFKTDCAVYIKRPSKPFEGEVRVSISLKMPDKRKRDIDNLLKPILDALTDYGVYCDDSQIFSLSIFKDPYMNAGEVLVIVEDTNITLSS